MIQSNRRAILGIFLILIGGLFLLENLDLLPKLPRWVFSWQMLLITIGIFNLLAGNRIPALFLIAIGGVFLLREFYWFDFEFRDYWPLILIIIGLSFIFRQKRKSNGRVSNENYFDALSVFGGGKQIFASPNLEGGKVTSIFGGSEIDLRQSKVQSGAVIDVFFMFGGSEIIVPNDWNIKVEISTILGGFSDSRTNVVSDENAPVVYIKGTTLLGGGELKN